MCSSKKFGFEPFYICFGTTIDYQASLVAPSVKNLPAVQETRVQFLGWEDPLEKDMATHSIFLPGESHGQGNLTGCSPWGR